jgi:methylated-DNA-[protein]-cysteine S-methyltransferase
MDEAPTAFYHPVPDYLQKATEQLQAYFQGQTLDFQLPLNYKQGTPFQQEVWQALLDIPYGQTRSYLQIAQQVGNPKAIRAVGAAIGQNPLAIVVPCHRVIGSDGSLVGFAGGLQRKKFLLDLEQSAKAGKQGSFF